MIRQPDRTLGTLEIPDHADVSMWALPDEKQKEGLFQAGLETFLRTMATSQRQDTSCGTASSIAIALEKNPVQRKFPYSGRTMSRPTVHAGRTMENPIRVASGL